MSNLVVLNIINQRMVPVEDYFMDGILGYRMIIIYSFNTIISVILFDKKNKKK